ncbi:protease modulator HflC [Fusibacter ferrireducens]|uniref:Protein HflC n=1 Tax=Fusibacter ferrireducens TaxID=2785058 RepID=A0ABR9ZQM5_9FIRM|nr:protease modulator HflC [Fusibacter ferrireducens]MBF4692768.1 protease modulator HflC [Fusibacter ferrireducens]
MDIHQGEPKQESMNNDRKKFEQKFQQNSQDMKKQIKKNMRFVGFIIVFILALILLSNCFYIVRENELATVREFGDIKTIVVDAGNTDAQLQNDLDSRFKNVKIVHQKGLHFKVPFITTVEKDTSKLLTYISNSAQINTKDKIKYQINMYAQWEITHPGLFRSALGTVNGANTKIDEVAYAVVIEKVNSLTSLEFLTDKESLNSVLAVAVEDLNEKLANQGIVIKDMDVYRTILPASNIESTYKKMIAEREAIAQQIRSEGLELYQNTVADTDRKVAEIKASAIEEAEKIRGEADATALEVYAQGFSKDPSFYEYWRTLISYEKTIDENSVIYLNSDNEYLKFFKNN